MRWALLLVVPGCSFGARAAPMTGDAAGEIDAAIGSDAANPMIDAPAGSCMDRWLAHTVRFQTPTALTELNTSGYERDPYITPDELTIYFSAGRIDTQPMGGTDIYTATRTQLGDPFGVATKFLAASTMSGSEGKMSLTGDGQQLFVASDAALAGTKGGTDIWFAQKAATGFGMLGQAHMAMVNTSGEELDPIVTPDGTAIYFAPTSGAPQQIYVATRATEAANFGAPRELTELEDTVDGTGTADPAISPDQKVILFSSGRTGSMGGNDIWYATRDDINGPFSAPSVVPDLNTGYFEGDAHLSQDGCRVYFDSTRNGNGDWDLFVAAQQ